MRLVSTQLMLVALCAAPIGILSSQEIKPRPAPRPARLPAPADLTALQLITGNIRVTWSGVAGATSYKLYRSVPPEGTTVLPLPYPTATAYDDSDVKAGSTYYYSVLAVDSSGGAGMKAGTQPVTYVAAPARTDPKQIFSWYGGLTTMGMNATSGFIKENVYSLKGVSKLRWFSMDESMVSMQQQPNGDALAVSHNKPGLVYIGVTAMPDDSSGVRTGIWRVIVQKTQ